jgi:hypothetical protein
MSCLLEPLFGKSPALFMFIHALLEDTVADEVPVLLIESIYSKEDIEISPHLLAYWNITQEQFRQVVARIKLKRCDKGEPLNLSKQ